MGAFLFSKSCFGVGAVVLALFFAGCGEERVVSKYVPRPKPIGATIEMPSVNVALGPVRDDSVVQLPVGKRMEIRGRVTGVSRLQNRVSAAYLRIGNPPRTLADGIMATTFIDDDTLDYSVTIEPIPITGEAQILVRFAQEDSIVFSGRLSN